MVEQIGGVSYVYAVGKDGETMLTIQQKVTRGSPPVRPVSVGIDPNTEFAFDAGGLRP